jgi:plastocyanin
LKAWLFRLIVKAASGDDRTTAQAVIVWGPTALQPQGRRTLRGPGKCGTTNEWEEYGMSDHTTFGLLSGKLRRREFLASVAFLGAGLVAACSSGGSTAATPAGSASTTTPASSGSTSTANNTAVQTTDANKFDPATVTIVKGGTVTWTNTSSMIHSVTDDPTKAVNKVDAQLPPGAQPWDSGLLQPNQTFSHTFDVAGTYKYFCTPHESLGMLGTIVVQ